MTTHTVFWFTPTGRRKYLTIAMRGRIKDIIGNTPYEYQGSNYNGYGYTDHDYYYTITPQQAKDIRAVLRDRKNKTKPKKLTEEEKIQKWCKRLTKLTDITIEQAEEIAQEKIDYKIDKINDMEDRQQQQFSVKRAKLIKKMERENPLRRITDAEHAHAILSASERHNNSNYDCLLQEAHDEEEMGMRTKGSAQEYARMNMQYA